MPRGSLVERDQQLRLLASTVAASAESGQVILVSGEAGFGKTSILKALIESLDHRYLVLASACEPVGIPAAFAPLYDVLHQLPEHIQRDLRSGSGRPDVYAGMLDLLKNERAVLIIEDVHWADEATLGLVRYLGRRMEATGSCLIVTFRSEELELTPLLRLVVADVGHVATRIELRPLSLEGVELMSLGRAVDCSAIYKATLGNPFFVEEVMNHPDQKLPPTIQNAVLASTDHLPAPALEILYLVALSPESVALDVILSGADEARACLDLASQRRLIVTIGDRVKCRHDLIRQSLLNAVPPATARHLHSRLLTELEAHADDSTDRARLAYHAIGAGHTSKAFAYSLLAAKDASKAGAHRQSVFHYTNALAYTSEMDREAHSAALLAAANENCLINAFDTSRELARRRLSLTDEPRARAHAHAWLAYFESRKNDYALARREAEIAVEGLSGDPPSEELALALYVLSWVALVEGDYTRSVTLGDDAVVVAQAVGSIFVEVQAATTVGGARYQLGDRRGKAQVEDSLKLALENGAGEPAARAFHYMGEFARRTFRLERAAHWFDQEIEYTGSRELDAWYLAAVSTMCAVNVARGRWSDADHDLERVRGQKTCLQTEIEVLVTAATLRARRGDPGSDEIVGEALSRMAETIDHDSLVIGCVLAMEGAWIGFLPLATAAERYESLRRSPTLVNDSWAHNNLAFWAKRLDFEPPDGDVPGPASLEWNGQIEDAFDFWESREFPVEAAITRSLIPGTDLDSVFSTLERMGADGIARGLRRELARRGFRRIPRGDRPATRSNPAGLTSRQLEVLRMLASGCSNADIAAQLFISEKTATHHVSAVLTKLNVASRLQAAALATANGWLDPLAPTTRSAPSPITPTPRSRVRASPRRP